MSLEEIISNLLIKSNPLIAYLAQDNYHGLKVVSNFVRISL
jgi:hypothetical protein